MDETKALAWMVGTWEGKCRTWFEPGKLADESTIRAEIAPILDGAFLRHTYSGAIQGKPRSGEEWIAFNRVRRKYETSWIDDFHMGYGIMFSEGEACDGGFFVQGQYSVGEAGPSWGWKTVYALNSEDVLTITAFNVTPDGQEEKALETVYHRLKAK